MGKNFHLRDTLMATHPSLGVSGKFAPQRTWPYLSVSLSSTSRMTALMTLSSSMTP